MGQSVKPPTASAGQAGADWRLPGPVRAVTFIPSGTEPFGARILITESISIEQPIYLSFPILANCRVRPSRRPPLHKTKRPRRGHSQAFRRGGPSSAHACSGAHSITSRARVSTALLVASEKQSATLLQQDMTRPFAP